MMNVIRGHSFKHEFIKYFFEIFEVLMHHLQLNFILKGHKISKRWMRLNEIMKYCTNIRKIFYVGKVTTSRSNIDFHSPSKDEYRDNLRYMCIFYRAPVNTTRFGQNNNDTLL